MALRIAAALKERDAEIEQLRGEMRFMAEQLSGIRIKAEELGGIARSCSGVPVDITGESLKEMMSKPAYWRDRDPATVEKVRQGFRSLYPETSVEGDSDA